MNIESLPDCRLGKLTPAEVVVSTTSFRPFAPYFTDARSSRDGLCGCAVALYIVAVIDKRYSVVDFRIAAVV